MCASPFETHDNMDYKEVRTGLEDKSLTLLDVRNPDELTKNGKIPGSTNIPCKYMLHYYHFILLLALLNSFLLYIVLKIQFYYCFSDRARTRSKNERSRFSKKV